MNSDKPALSIQHVTKKYDARHGIMDIDLTVATGEIFGFLGPNGAGKSTTINTVLDILRPDAGTINILGHDHHHHAKRVHRQIGYLSGDMETDPSLSGKQYLRFVSHLYGGVNQDRIDQLAIRLKADTATQIKHLSRGSKQKIGLIAALMHDPELLILDEPTSGLDPLIQSEFNAIIREHKERGKTAFISSHILSQVQTMCDRVGFIRDGKLVTVSKLETLMQQAPRRVSAHFQGDVPLQELQTLDGIRSLRHDDGAVSFLFQGDINQLVALFAKNPLRNVNIMEADLEELFMSYYRKQEKPHDV